MTIEEEIARTLRDFLQPEGFEIAESDRIFAQRLTPILNRVRAEAWFAGYDKGNLDGYFGTNKERENSPYVEFDPYRAIEQNSEGKG